MVSWKQNMLPQCHNIAIRWHGLIEIPAESITERKICRTGTGNTTTLAKFWSKSRFFGTNILHALIDNAVHCTSGEGGMWEILVVTNMKKQPEKSGMTDLVLFSAIGRWPSEKWLLRPQKWTQKKSDKFYLLLGMCEHQFGCILPHVGPSSQCKIDSPIFFQPQRGRHSWLWFSQSSWLD